MVTGQEGQVDGDAAPVTGGAELRMGRYRGPDRRESMAAVDPFPLGLPLAAVVAVGLLTAFVLRLAPGTEDAFGAAGTVARIILAVAGLAAVLRWRLDRMSRSYWYGLAALAGAIPLLAVTTADDAIDAVTYAWYVVTIPLVWRGNRAPEVDASLRLPRTIGWAALLAAGAVVLAAVAGNHTLALLLVAAPLIGLTVDLLARYRDGSTANGRWYAPALLATALAPLVSIASGTAGHEYGAAGPMLLVAAGVAFTGSIAELHYAAARHQGLVLAATIARDDAVEERSRQEAETANRLHEVRSRVAAIEGGVSVMRPPDEHEMLSDAVRQEIERLRKLVAPAPRDEVGPFNVLDALRSTLVVAASSWPVDFSIPDQLMAIGRSDDLAQVVHGLIHNASKYAPGSPIEVTAAVDGAHVLIHVDDHGAGVPRGERDLIFERGWRGSGGGRDGGYGLGLAIARELMTGVDGDLWVAPRPGGGARFTASLPAWGGLVSIDGAAHRPGSTEAPALTDEDRALARQRLRRSEGTA
jgi:two-component system OmpR family sensor kinase